MITLIGSLNLIFKELGYSFEQRRIEILSKPSLFVKVRISLLIALQYFTLEVSFVETVFESYTVS